LGGENLSKVKARDADFIFLSSMLHARETKLLTADKISRMLETARFDEAAKLAEECGYRDMSGMDVFSLEDVLSSRRAALFKELGAFDYARPLIDLFRIKYDYHNVKVLVKSMGANVDATRILSSSGRVPSDALAEAFISGDRDGLPEAMRNAIHDGVSTLSRTSNPQLSDVAIDKAYFDELHSLSKDLGAKFVKGYVRLLTDSANLRTFVRSQRTSRGADFLHEALIEGGNANVSDIEALPPTGEGLARVFTAPELAPAVKLAETALSGGGQTQFERECDNATMTYLAAKKHTHYGASVVLTYLVEIEWEITSLRMILSGKLAGVSPETIRERLRDAYV
jgi:V/A-type H+-transporting ATPase subunit C